MATAEQTVRRVHALIATNQYYEAHQAVRTVVNRYVRAKDYGSAIGLLYTSAFLLLRAGQCGSGGDLVMYLLKIYVDAHVKPDGASKGRVSQLVYYLDPKDGVLKQIAQHASQWAIGEPDLAHVFGTQFLRGGLLLEAEKYLLHGTVESAELLAKVHTEAQAQAGSTQLVERGVLGFLAVQNVRNARTYLALMDPEHANLMLWQLVETCQTKDAQIYKRVAEVHNLTKALAAYPDALKQIEKDYFAITPFRQPSLADLLGAMA